MKKKKKKKKEKRKLMVWIEVYGGQRSLAFELTTAFFVLYKTLNLAICR